MKYTHGLLFKSSTKETKYIYFLSERVSRGHIYLHVIDPMVLFFSKTFLQKMSLYDSCGGCILQKHDQHNQ